MVIKTALLKDYTTKILSAVDTSSSDKSNINETLELEAKGNLLTLNVTNREYFVSVRIPLDCEESFHASVDADLFLKLISQTTTEDVELGCTEKVLQVRGNGSYKLPLIFEGKNLLSLPRIVINNPTVQMPISTEILNSIALYNSKEITKDSVASPVQRYYYVDEKGCLTFTTGACVNNFELEKPIRILLSGKIVRLFKLFSGKAVKFTLGFDALSDILIQTKVTFEDEIISLTAVLGCGDDLINMVPVQNIRHRANDIYPYSITLNKNTLLQAINRLLIFAKKLKSSVAFDAKFTFGPDGVDIAWGTEEVETVAYTGSEVALTDAPYEAILDLNSLKATLTNCEESHLTLRFGNDEAFVVARTNILNVIPQK